MKRIYAQATHLTLWLSFFLFMTLALNAGVPYQLQMPLEHGHTYGYGGHGPDSSQYFGRKFHYQSANSLIVDYYTDYDNYWDEESGPDYNQVETAFNGEVQTSGDCVLVKLPASYNSIYSSRQMTIRNDGYVLADRYYSSAIKWMDYHYYYNQQGLATGELKTLMKPLSPPQILYTKSDYVLDGEGRRLAENISSSTDSLTWTPIASRQYVYTGNPHDSSLNYEKYWAYQARDYGLSIASYDLNLVPYVCNNWSLASMTFTPSEGSPTLYSYLYQASPQNILYGTYNNYIYWWNDLGQPLSSFISIDVSGSSYKYTWQSITVGADDPSAPPISPQLLAYPNPFNTSTELVYKLAQAGEPVLRIYNLKGQLLRSYKPGTCATGEYTWEFDGRDEKGYSLNNGIYLIKLSLGDQEITRKITLLK